MRVRAESSLFKVWLALVCAISAGFTGDLITRHGHTTHTTRNSRGTGHRSSRGVGRDGYGDHWAEVEILQEEISVLSAAPVDHPAPAILPVRITWVPQFVQLAWATVSAPTDPRATDLLATPARAPPVLS